MTEDQCFELLFELLRVSNHRVAGTQKGILLIREKISKAIELDQYAKEFFSSYRYAIKWNYLRHTINNVFTEIEPTMKQLKNDKDRPYVNNAYKEKRNRQYWSK